VPIFQPARMPRPDAPRTATPRPAASIVALPRGQARRRQRACSIPGIADGIASRSCGLKTAASRSAYSGRESVGAGDRLQLGPVGKIEEGQQYPLDHIIHSYCDRAGTASDIAPACRNGQRCVPLSARAPRPCEYHAADRRLDMTYDVGERPPRVGRGIQRKAEAARDQ
jgi:hypothetical protein